LLIQIPGEPIRKIYPDHDSLGWGFRVSDGPFDKVTSRHAPIRVFPLKTAALHLPLEEDVPYDDALALLRAIEDGHLSEPETQRTQTGPNSWSVKVSGFGKPAPAELPFLFEIRRGENDTLEIRTRTHPFGGRSYQFQKRADGSFQTIRGGGWR